MTTNAIRWFEIYVKDMERAKKFYETVLGNKLTKMEVGPEIEMWGFPANPERFGSGGSLVKIPEGPCPGTSTIVYFGSDDCSVEESRVVAAGGKVMKPKMSIGPYGFISLIVDTEGTCIGIHSMK